MNDTELRELLVGVTTIAVVGASTNAAKASNQVPRFLIDAGYTVIPLHPNADEILGQTAYRTLAEIPAPVDIVDVFRPAAEAPELARQAIAIGAGTLWLQLGVTSPEAKQLAEEAGLTYLENICIGETTRRLGVHPQT